MRRYSRGICIVTDRHVHRGFGGKVFRKSEAKQRRILDLGRVERSTQIVIGATRVRGGSSSVGDKDWRLHSYIKSSISLNK